MIEEESSYAQNEWGRVGRRSQPSAKEKDIIDRAIAAASIESGVPPSAIVGRKRLERYIAPRFIVYKLCMDSKAIKLSHLGNFLGRDHGAVWHGIKAMTDWLESNDRSRDKFRELYERTEKRYKEYESDPERMVQELSVYDGRQGDDLPPEA
jgi:hypothetical protein|tara:strand:+ start:6653 stop:7108 length:456 start_codon:yes stop_codon:yes gene_type:complete